MSKESHHSSCSASRKLTCIGIWERQGNWSQRWQLELLIAPLESRQKPWTIQCTIVSHQLDRCLWNWYSRSLCFAYWQIHHSSSNASNLIDTLEANLHLCEPKFCLLWQSCSRLRSQIYHSECLKRLGSRGCPRMPKRLLPKPVS